MELPQSLGWMNDTSRGRAWLEQLPLIRDECARRWGLRLGDPFAGSYVSLVLPAQDARGIQLVMKIQFPDRESEYEADALIAWSGDGAVRLIDVDRSQRALLIERCDPGQHLSAAGPAVALDVLLGLLPRLWVPAVQAMGTLAEEVSRWTSTLPEAYATAGEPFERSLLDSVITILADLASSQGDQVLLHQDLHGDNVLSSEREPWLVIDPKPLVGEREFGLSPIIRSVELGHSKEHVIYRLDRLSGELGLDRERARLWAAGQAIAWAFEGGKVLPGHVEMARWLLAS